SMSIAMMSSAVSALRTDLPELMSTWDVPGNRQLMWPLKSITSACSSMRSASASCCLRLWACAGLASSMAMVPAMMVMVVAVTMRMVMVVVVIMAVIVVMIVAMRMRAARILGEHQRLDRHRHGERRHAHAPEVDVIEIPQDDAVDREHLAADAPFVPQERADRLRDVAVEDEHQRLRLLDGARQRVEDAARERGKARIRRRPLPLERERHVGLALDEVERLEVLVDRARDGVG